MIHSTGGMTHKQHRSVPRWKRKTKYGGAPFKPKHMKSSGGNGEPPVNDCPGQRTTLGELFPSVQEGD